MKHPPATLIDAFKSAAHAAQVAETAYWKQAADGIARLESARVVCFRRLRLVKLLAGASMEAASADAAIVAQRFAVASEFGWDPERADHKAVLDRLETPSRTVWAALHNPSGAAAAGSIYDELARFEAWYQGHAGQPFYALFDQYVPQAPLVDF